jgi:hypothetical protein
LRLAAQEAHEKVVRCDVAAGLPRHTFNDFDDLWHKPAAEKRLNAVILSSSEGSRSECFSRQCEILRRLLAPQNDSANEFFRNL